MKYNINRKYNSNIEEALRVTVEADTVDEAVKILEDMSFKVLDSSEEFRNITVKGNK